jgi:hypothetical protein
MPTVFGHFQQKDSHMKTLPMRYSARWYKLWFSGAFDCATVVRQELERSLSEFKASSPEEYTNRVGTDFAPGDVWKERLPKYPGLLDRLSVVCDDLRLTHKQRDALRAQILEKG